MRILKNAFLVSIMMAAILLCCSSQVQAAQDGDYAYTVTDGKTQITKYTGAGGDVTIPSTLGGAPVISIGELAFRDCTGLTSISIPQGVTSIGYGAFSGCTGLTSVSIPQGVTSIDESVFDHCGGLTGISLPQGVTSIGYRAFYYCTGLTSISIPQGVTSIGDLAFSYCGDLTSISLPQGVTSIGYGAFSNCGGLTNVSLPQEVTSIGEYAFYNCTGLTSIRFNSATTTIFDSADTIPDATKIIGYAQSTAKDYAAKYNRTFEVMESIAIITPATTGFTVALSPSLAGLTASDFRLLDSSSLPVTITSATTLDSGATYAISAALSAGQTYMVTAVKTGYAFGTPQSVVVPLAVTSLSYESASVDTTNKIVTLTFSDLVLNNTTSLDELKKEITFAADGVNFKALSASDAVTLKDKTLVITFSTALKGTMNKIKVATNTLKDSSGKALQTEVTAGPINAFDECFIATAAFGSKNQTDVVLLRHFRDQFLLTNPIGRWFVQTYYHYSPPIAQFIAGNGILKFVTRVLLLPFVAVVYMLFHPVLSVGLLAAIAFLIVQRRRRKVVLGVR